jgi:hypothetical protein
MDRMTARLLTILGTGKRDRVRYRFAGGEPIETSSIDAAIVRLFDVSHVVAFATTDATKARKVNDSLREGLSDGHWPASVDFEEVSWMPGATEREFWQLFELFRQRLGQVCDEVGDGEVIVNLTHGYRTQPLIAQAAVLFELEDRRRRRKPPVPVRLLYGAYGGGWKEGEPTPDAEIWDMTTLLEAGAWATAVSSLRDHARADRFEELLSDLKRRLGRARTRDQKVPDFAALGRATRDVVDSLVTNRTHRLKSAPAEFLERWRQHGELLLQRLPPIRGPLEAFVGQVEGLAATAVASEQGVRASLGAARWLMESEQFSALTALLRETLVTITALRQGEESTHEPGVDCSGRDGLERRLGLQADILVKQKRASLWNELGVLRNDVQHAAYNAEPTDGRGVRQKAADLLRRLEDEAGRLTPGPFVNLTNHPSSEWAVVQTNAALRLGGGVVDVPFPRVSPEADQKDLEQLAEKLLGDVLSLGAAAVGVQGEHTLSLLLVARLQAAGIDCYAATTPRVAEVVEGTKTSQFTFTRWRKYPSLRGAP